MQIKDKDYVEPLKFLVVEATEIPDDVIQVFELKYTEKVKVAFPRDEEELIDLLYRCKLKDSRVMQCRWCSLMCDEKATEGKEKFKPKLAKRDN